MIDFELCRENFEKRALAQQAQRETLRHQARQDVLSAIAQVMPHYPQITQVYLFGSVTKPGQFSTRSDIDIAVVGTDAETYFSLWCDLETACPTWVIDLREMNHPCHFSDTVRHTGERVYESASGTFES